MKPRSRWVAVVAPLAAAALAAPGCVTEFDEGQEPLPPEPRAVPDQPSDLVVNEIGFHPTLYARDTNANGKGDVIDATVYLWSQPYPYPLHVKQGVLTLTLYRPGDYGAADAAPLKRWEFTGPTLDAARARTLPGPCYLLEISLLNEDRRAGDVLGLPTADLVAEFTGGNGRTVASGVSTVHLDHPHQ